VKEEEQGRADAQQNRRGVTQSADVPTRLEREKCDEKLEEEISGDEQELEHERGANEGAETRGASRQFDKADGRGGKLMQGQPEIFGVTFFREVEREEKDGQHGEEDGVDELEQALEELRSDQRLSSRSRSPGLPRKRVWLAKKPV
jgi:hypothetical protein